MGSRHRSTKYGVSETDYTAMLLTQGNCCAICQISEQEYKLTSERYNKFAVDHCHTSGKVRGLLCTNCNTALGLLKDNKSALQRAIDYL